MIRTRTSVLPRAAKGLLGFAAMGRNFKNACITAGAVAAGCGIAASLLRSRDRFPLEGKVVLITGGSRGLGLAMARRFAQEGAMLALTARDEEDLGLAKDDLRRSGADIFTFQCDVSSRAQVETLIEAVIDHYGRIDVLVNNAGIIQVGPLDTVNMEDFEKAMGTMYWGTVYASLAVLPGMRERGSGRIVNIASIGGKVSIPHLLPYSCAKFAAVAFSEGLRAELQGSGVKTVTIAPGLMRTGSFLNVPYKGDDDREAAWFSLSSSLPCISMSAARAADQIVRATKSGPAEKILSLPANLLSILHGLFPGMAADALGVMNRMLPHGHGDRVRVIKPYVRRHWLLNTLTTLGQSAARRYREEY